MNRLPLTVMAALLLSVVTAWADPVEDGVAAYRRKDYSTALRIFRSTAAQGNAFAQHNLGVMYGNGQGTAQDYVEAMKWYRLAAAQGSAAAQFNIAVMYGNGQGVAKDLVHAHAWFKLSAESGDPESVRNRDLTKMRMTPQQIAQAEKLARDCQQRKFKGCD